MLLPFTHLTGAIAAGPDEMTLWDQVRQGGFVLLVRSTATSVVRADAPPSRGGCVLERGIDNAGQALAVRLGQTFREQGVPVSRILSSAACPSVETAQIAFGASEPWQAMAGESGPGEDRKAWRMRHASSLASQLPANGNLVLVTDKLIISELTNRSVSAGDILVLQPTGEHLRVAGQLSLVP